MSTPLWLPNLIKPATGTDVGGKKSLDVYVSGGALSFTEGATAADGAAPPAEVKVVAGVGTDGFVHTLHTDNTGNMYAAQAGAWNITDITGTVSLPTGAATEATLVTLDSKFNTLGQKAMAASAPVVFASDQSAIPTSQSGTWSVTSSDAGFTKANTPARNVYSSVNVTTAAYVQLVASTTSATKEVSIFDSSGQTLILALGAAASEVDHMLVFPGGNGREKWAIPAGSRVSIKAVSATAAVGEISINFWG